MWCNVCFAGETEGAVSTVAVIRSNPMLEFEQYLREQFQLAQETFQRREEQLKQVRDVGVCFLECSLPLLHLFSLIERGGGGWGRRERERERERERGRRGTEKQRERERERERERNES